MYCPNCRNKLAEEVDFCHNCGTNIKELRNIEELSSSTTFDKTNLNTQIIDNSIKINNETKKTNKIKLFVIATVLLIAVVSIVLIFIFNKKESNNSNNLDVNENDFVIDNDMYTTYHKLKDDYENGKIDVNKYFTELVYYKYDSFKLDENYNTDNSYYSNISIKEMLEILEENENAIDKEIIKQFLINASLANVKIGNSSSVLQPQNVSSAEYTAKFLDVEENTSEEDSYQSNAYNHYLTNVKLSTNGKFLIWYTVEGEDAITDDMAYDIASNLETTVSRYEDLFGVEYSYYPYIDNKLFNDDYNNAKKLLEQNNIPISVLKEAMSVYIYDTGSEGTEGIYIDEHDAAKIINRSLILDILDEDGIINYPYIVLNRRKLYQNMKSLRQVYNHELFHHFQYIYCKKNINDRCLSGDYSEGAANLASALVDNSSTTNNFLNGHATVYTRRAYTELATINDGVNYGYAAFPYFYVYTMKVDNWSDVLMKAHLYAKPYEYIQKNTSKEDLNRVSDEATYRILTNGFDKNALYSNKSVIIKEVLEPSKNITENIEAGAIVFYEVNKNSSVKIVSGNRDYVGVKLYGYVDGIYSEILSSYDTIYTNLAIYGKYDKFYIAINNSNLVDVNTYTIEVDDIQYAENTEFITTFDNYNIEIEMDISFGGINTNTVLSGIMDEKHQKEYLDIETTTFGSITLNYKAYHDFNTGYSYMTRPFGGDGWWKEQSASQVVDLKQLLEKLTSMKNVTKVSDNHYKVKITEEDIKGLIATGNVSDVNVSGDIYVDVYTENGYITRLEYDLTDIADIFENFKTTIKYSNYNSAGEVKIPQSVIDNAKSQ